MSETEWTPGPWRVRRTDDDTWDIVATVSSSRAWLIAGSITQREEAVLIAAAPDLYEALAMMERTASASPEIFRMARAALARARGEKP